MLNDLRNELARLKTRDVQLQTDKKFGQPVDSAVAVTIGSRSYSIAAAGLLEMLKSLPDGATEAAVKEALEMRTEQPTGLR